MTVIKTVALPKVGHNAHFVHRDMMRPRHALKRFYAPYKQFAPPPTLLPVDSTGNATVSCPMDGNDTYGDCGEAMAAHGDNIFTFRQGQGTESTFTDAALVAQYEKVSGGDNGLDEEEVVNSIWKVGIAGNAAAVITDALDIDVTNVPLAQFAIDQFYLICMAWSVPDAFIQGFATGTVWPNAGKPDPNNGHFVPLADIGGPLAVAPGGVGFGGTLNGFYRLWTWGTWCWVSPAFVASVDPACFIVFSPRQFDPKTGLDSKGRHITTQAALWVECGGAPIPQAVIEAFPPISGPGPAPSPTPAPAPAAVFTIEFPKAVPAGARVHIPVFSAPSPIAAGIYDVVPSAASSADVKAK
jgi:hypothetical protein